ncbi:MAG: DMT family transporter [Chloroflexi bacterium]|nr:DMT family transporter [Chloroflexota bacterium]
MSTIMIVLIVGLIGGLAVGLQQPLSSLLAGRMGMMEGVFIIQLGGVIGSGLFVLARRGGGLGTWRESPWYALGAGLLSLVIIGAVSYAIPRVGAVTSTFLIVAGQLIASVVIDHYGLFETTVRPLDPSRLLGIGVLFAGIWLIVR